jgi:hypothetical protein
MVDFTLGSRDRRRLSPVFPAPESEAAAGPRRRRGFTEDSRGPTTLDQVLEFSSAVPAHHQEDVMQNAKGQFRIELTPEQKAQVRNLTGKDADAVELSVEELEERIAPIKVFPKGGN